MNDTVVLDGKCTLDITADGDCNLDTIVDGQYGEYITVHTGEYYTGATAVTPSEGGTVLVTQDLLMPSNVTVVPIPSNYGRIAWNGSHLTVY